MITCYPKIDYKFKCPNCTSEMIKANDIIFQGMHILADIRCLSCIKDFYCSLPIGHALYFPVAFSKNGSESIYAKEAKLWYAKPLLDSQFKFPKLDVSIEKRIYKNYKNVIILNCLDYCYGHVFLKLLNAQRHLMENKHFGLVIILPKSFLWLVPDEVAEIWILHTKLESFKKWIGPLDRFVKKEIKRFDNVMLSKAYTHFNNDDINFGAFTKHKKFNLADYDNLTPQITFLCREDRLWINNKFENHIYKFCIKFKIFSHVKNYFISRQNTLFNKIVKLVRNDIQDVKFAAIGIGCTGKLGHDISDLRTKGEVTEATEKKWCSVYARSHIVIGIHGSHMHIPTSLAAGFIEILPRHKIPHIAEDISLSHKSRYMYFLGRHLDEYSTPHLIASHVKSMIRNFSIMYNTTEKLF